MNKLLQLSSFLIGSDDDVRLLAAAERAHVLVISDSHGNKPLVHRILSDFGRKADALIFCGDGISDIMSALDEALSDSSFAGNIPSVVAFVQGNNDSDRYPVEFKPHLESDDSFYHEVVVPKSACFLICGHKVFVVHGHLHDVYYATDTLKKTAEKLKADLVFYGHTHMTSMTENRSSLLINPGSCSLPRGGFPPSFAFVDVMSGENNIVSTFYKIELCGGTVRYEPFIPKEARLWW